MIDKDLACSLLATRIGASLLLITTAVSVSLDFEDYRAAAGLGG